MTTVGHEQQPEALADLTGRLHGVLDDLHELDLDTATDPGLLAAMPALIWAGRRLSSIEATVFGKRVVWGIAVSCCMPFAACESGITRFLQCFAQGNSVFIQRARVANPPIAVDHETDSCLVLVEPSQQAGTRRTATRGVVHLREAKSILCQIVQARSFDLAAIAAKIRVAQIIGEYHDDVWLQISLGLECQWKQVSQEQPG